MGGKIIRKGLHCKVNAKAMLIRRFLREPEDSKIVIRAIRKHGIGVAPVPKAWREQIEKEFGVCVNSVASLEDGDLAETYDVLEREGAIRRWLGSQAHGMRLRAEEILGQDQEEKDIDATGFLVYAVLENERCRQKLFEYMGEQGGLCYQAYRKSVYCGSPLLKWFPQQKVLGAMLCLGLLERVRAEEDNAAYEAFISIASAGYKKARKYVKRCDVVDGKAFQDMLADGEVAYCLSSGVIGLVLAEDVQTPIHMDFLLLSFLPVLKRYGDGFLEADAPVEISAEGRERCREMMEKYHCDDYAECYFGYPRRGSRALRPELVEEDMENDPVVRHMSHETVDFGDIFTIFGLNLRMLQGVRLTEQEAGQLFSLCPEIRGEEYMPVLLVATLCKYLAGIGEGYRPEEELMRLKGAQGEAPEEKACHGQVLEARRELERLRGEEARLRRERDVLAKRLDELKRALDRRKEQLAQLKERQEQGRRDLEELRDFVCYLTEHPSVGDDGSGDGDSGQECLHKLDLGQRRVVVIGGHENWQRRFREHFPMWQFLPAGKNNFDAGCVRNKEIIILNTAVLKHSCYYRIMAERSEGQMVLYVHGNNLGRCLEELERQIQSGRGRNYGYPPISIDTPAKEGL